MIEMATVLTGASCNGSSGGPLDPIPSYVRVIIDSTPALYIREHIMYKPTSWITRVSYGNFNMSHQINIQGEGRREVGGGICKSVITQSKSGSKL